MGQIDRCRRARLAQDYATKQKTIFTKINTEPRAMEATLHTCKRLQSISFQINFGSIHGETKMGYFSNSVDVSEKYITISLATRYMIAQTRDLYSDIEFNIADGNEPRRPASAKSAVFFGLQRDDPPSVSADTDGAAARVLPFPQATLCLVAAVLDPAARPAENDEHTICHLPRAAFGVGGKLAGAGRILALPLDRAADADPVLLGLKACLLGLLAQPGHLDSPVLDLLVASAHAHIALNYSHAGPGRASQDTGLALWQLRRTKDLVDSNIGVDIGVEEMAAVCGLSSGHFARAFRRSTGQPPHQWVLGRRVELAKSLLAEATAPLSEIALTCGFSDQSHLTRTFSRKVGVTPGAWRRQYRNQNNETSPASLL